MKKFFIGLTVATSLFYTLNAATIDTKAVEFNFTGFKTLDYVPVTGKFDNVKYTFGKDMKSITGTLKGATATIDPKSVNMNAEPTTTNLRETFFGNYSKGDIKVVFEEVTESVNNTGAISAKVSMNGLSAIIPLRYEVNDGRLIAKGVLDLNSFNSKKALAALTKVAPGHKGLTWSIIDLEFSAPIK